MSNITEKEYSACYEHGKLVFEGKESEIEAVRFLSNPTGVGMNKNSAKYYVTAYLKMRCGGLYKKTINNDSTRYYLERIYAESGKAGLRIALIVLKRHLDFYSKQGKGNLVLLRNIYDCFMEEIVNKE